MTPLVLLLVLIASQMYWGARGYAFLRNRISAKWQLPVGLAMIALIAPALLYNADRILDLPDFGPQPNPTHLGWADFSLAILQWWIICSILAFVLLLPVRAIQFVIRALVPKRTRVTATDRVGTPTDRPIQPERRHFLEQASGALLAAPFVAGGYALLYGRLNLEITQKQIRMPRLPREFHGFRIAQLSDIHISAFMSDEQIKKFADIANSIRADLIALTGDFVTWDPNAIQAVVKSLSGLRAPFGVWGCLGNHEAWSDTKDAIAPLFEQANIRILRDANTAITRSGERLNLIGIEPDHGWSTRRVPDGLIASGSTNILLSHYPTVFNHASELGVDLMLSGHTHGGQVRLNFISPDLAPKILRTPYVAGWYQRESSQLYVNRGLGTIGVPMRAGMSPEISVLELVRT